MSEQTSLTDIIGGLTPSDSVMAGALLGGLAMWFYWNRKQVDTDTGFKIDKTSKTITLGAFVSGFMGWLMGSILGSLASNKFGLDLQSSTVLAFLGGMIGPWAFRALANKNYEYAVKLANSPWLANQLPRAGYSLPEHIPRERLTVLDKKIMGLTGDRTMAASGASVHDWDQRRELVLHRITSWFTKQIPPTKDELAEIHRIFPTAPDLDAIKAEIQSLSKTQMNLTLSEKMNYDQILLTQSEMIDAYATRLDEAQKQLDQRDKRYQPQHRIPREVVYSIGSAIAGYIAGLII